MAHELATTNGRTAMMYTGEIPWHGLGTRLEEQRKFARQPGRLADLEGQSLLREELREPVVGLPIRRWYHGAD